LKKKGVRVRSKSGKTKRAKYILHPVFLFIMHLWMFEISKPLFHLSLIPKTLSTLLFESFTIQLIGAILILISIGFLIASLFSFYDSLRFGMNANNLGKLITSGVFSITRNPFFLSIEFLIIGNALIFPSPFLIGFALITIVSIHFFILKEEKFMKENYGAEYKEYSKKVKRYF